METLKIAEKKENSHMQNARRLENLFNGSSIIYGNVLLDRNIHKSSREIQRDGVDFLECVLLKDTENKFHVHIYRNPNDLRNTITIDRKGKILSSGEYDKIDLGAVLLSFQEKKGLKEKAIQTKIQAKLTKIVPEPKITFSPGFEKMKKKIYEARRLH